MLLVLVVAAAGCGADARTVYNGGDLALLWSGERGRWIDERWERLDRFLREVA